jgi:4-hydroxysphinganine ceramide fatty acyl 2-hydroxylase
VSTAVFGLVLGVFIWTALEYTLHRWLFHMEPPGKSPRLITFHFLMHGLHHKVVKILTKYSMRANVLCLQVPFDGTRLVFPPLPASILGSVIYLIFKAILPTSILFSTGAGITLGNYIIKYALYAQH